MKLMQKIRKSKRGFTLIELLVVIAILGVLAAVAVPNIVSFIGKGNVGAANAELGMVNTAVQAAMAGAGTSTVTTPFVIGGATHTDLGTPKVTTYIQGGVAAVKGSYTVDATGLITAATYPGGPTFSATTHLFS